MKNHNNSTFSASYSITTNDNETVKKTDIDFEKSVSNVVNSNAGYDPVLNEAPEVKDYQKPNIDTTNFPAFIPEATFDAVAQEVTFHQNSESKTPAPESESSQPQPGFNPQLNNLSKSQKRVAAEMMADTALNAYSMLWQKVLTPAAQFNEKKLQKEFAAGTIDPNLGVYIDHNTTVPIKEFTKGFNENVEDALKVTDEFKQEVREPLVRILEKRGLGLTDEQKVGWEVIQDFGIKTATIISIRNDIKSVMENFRSDTKKNRVSQPSAPAASQNQSDAQPARKEPAADFVVDEDGIAQSSSEVQNDTTKNNTNNDTIEVVKSNVPTFAKHPLLQQLDDQALKEKNGANMKSTSKTAKSSLAKKTKPTTVKATDKK